MDRASQFDTVRELVDKTQDARMDADVAAAKAAVISKAIPQLTTAYNSAHQRFMTDESVGGELASARQALLTAQEQLGPAIKAAQQAYTVFTTVYTQLDAAVTNLLADPGATEQV